MTWSLQALIALAILLPGFLVIGVIEALTVPKRRSEYERVVAALLYSAIVHGLCFPIAKVLWGTKPFAVTPEGAHDWIAIAGFVAGYLPLVLGVALLMGFLLALAIAHDFPLRKLRDKGWTKRTSLQNVWSDVFSQKIPPIKSWLILTLENGTRIFGFPLYFPDTFEEGTWFLGHAAWVTEDDKMIPLEGQGILVTPCRKVAYVEFVDVKPREMKGVDRNVT